MQDTDTTQKKKKRRKKKKKVQDTIYADLDDTHNPLKEIWMWWPPPLVAFGNFKTGPASFVLPPFYFENNQNSSSFVPVNC